MQRRSYSRVPLPGAATMRSSGAIHSYAQSRAALGHRPRGPRSLEQDDRTASGIDAGAEEFEGPSTWNRKALAENLPVCSDEVAIVPRVEEQQGHARDIAIAQLERETTLKRLSIPWARFCLDAVPPIQAHDDGIPSATIVRTWERNLG